MHSINVVLQALVQLSSASPRSLEYHDVDLESLVAGLCNLRTVIGRFPEGSKPCSLPSPNLGLCININRKNYGQDDTAAQLTCSAYYKLDVGGCLQQNHA